MGKADFVLPCGEHADETDVRQALENYGIDTEIKRKRILFENGYIASGMPSPEEQFEKATGKKFNPKTMEIEYSGAEGEEYSDEPVTTFNVVEKITRVPERPIGEPEPGIGGGSGIGGQGIDDPGTGKEPGVDGPGTGEEPESQQENEQRYITKITKIEKFKKLAAGILVAIGLAMGINLTTEPIVNPEPTVEPETIVQEVSTTLNYTVTETEQDISDDVIEDIVKAKIGSLNLGDEIYVPDGTIAYTNSLQTGGYEEYGNNWKESGLLPITGISIVKDGRIIDCVENFTNDESLHDVNFQEYIDKVCEENGFNEEDVTIMIHTDVRGGWTDIRDLINETTLTPDDIEPAVEALATYTGTIEDFEGDTFTFITEDGTEVTLDATEGTGMELVGSDGETYIADIETYEISDNIEEFSALGEEFLNDNEVETKTQLGYDLTDLSKALIIAGVGLAAALAILQKKRNDFNRDNPMYAEFESQEELDQFLEEAFQSDEEKSKETLKEFLKRTFVKEDKGIVELLTDENLNEIIDIVKENMEIERVGVKDNRVVAETTKIKEDGEPEIAQTNLSRDDEIKVAREVDGEKIEEGTLSKKMIDAFKKFHKEMREIPQSKINRVSRKIEEDSKTVDNPEIESKEQDTDERDD